MKKLTLKRLMTLERVKDELESQLDRLAKQYSIITSQLCSGYMDGFSIWDEEVTVNYRDSYQGGWDDYSINIPFAVFESGDLAAAAEKALADKLAKQQRETEKRVELAALARKRQYEKLKEEFG